MKKFKSIIAPIDHLATTGKVINVIVPNIKKTKVNIPAIDNKVRRALRLRT
jgi:hypothetical protein